MRPAQNRKPATYRCPFCGNHLPALSEHFLVAPEGDMDQRRHAHTECVLAARKTGKLPTEEEWRATQPRPPSLWRQLWVWANSRSRGKKSMEGDANG